jgi:hypothetical protein
MAHSGPSGSALAIGEVTRASLLTRRRRRKMHRPPSSISRCSVSRTQAQRTRGLRFRASADGATGRRPVRPLTAAGNAALPPWDAASFALRRDSAVCARRLAAHRDVGDAAGSWFDDEATQCPQRTARRQDAAGLSPSSIPRLVSIWQTSTRRGGRARWPTRLRLRLFRVPVDIEPEVAREHLLGRRRPGLLASHV